MCAAALAAFALAAVAPSASAATLLNVDVSAARQRANTVETWNFQFTTVGAVPVGGDIRIVFPGDFNASFGSGTKCSVQAPSSAFNSTTTVVDGQTIVCELGNGRIAANTVTRLTVSNMRNPTKAGTTGTFSIQTRGNTDRVIDQHLTNTEDILEEELEGIRNLRVVGATQRTGAFETWRLEFDTTKPVPRGGQLRIQFAEGFQLSTDPPSDCQWQAPLDDNSTSAVINNQTIACHLGQNMSIPASTLTIVNVTGVRNPTTEQYTRPFRIETWDGESILDTAANNQELIRASPFRSGPFHNQSSVQAGVAAVHQFEFVLFNSWAADGILEIGFPAGYRMNDTGPGAVNVTFAQGGDGGFGVPLRIGESLLFPRKGGTGLFSGTRVVVKVGNVTNSDGDGPTMAFMVATLNKTRAVHDRGEVGGQLLGGNATTNSTDAASGTGPGPAAPANSANTTTGPLSTTATFTDAPPSPIGPLGEDDTPAASPRGEGSPGAGTVLVLAGLVAVAGSLRRRKA